MNRGSEWNWDIVESVVEWVWMEGINVRESFACIIMTTDAWE